MKHFFRIDLKIISIFLVLVVLFGLGVQLANNFSTRMCLFEIHQRANENLAGNLVNVWYSSEGHVIKPGRISTVFRSILDANDGIEIYLLNKKGEIVCSSAPFALLSSSAVSLTPINSYLSDSAEFPIYGEDPKSSQATSLFSAAPISDDGKILGYLYVLLDSNKSKSIYQLLEESYFSWVGPVVTLTGLIAIVLIGSVTFNRSTSRLRRLTQLLKDYELSNFEKAELLSHSKTKPAWSDEISQLENVTGNMAHKISEQINALKKTTTFHKELVTNIAHDLRTPLASLHGYLEALKQKGTTLPEAERDNFVDIILRKSRALNKILNDIAELVDLENGLIVMDLKPVSLNSVLSELSSSKVYINFGQINRDNITVTADTNFLKKALMKTISLLSNQNQEPVEIILAEAENQIILEIVNKNWKIDDELIPFLFERVHQATDNPESKGLGVDLAIARKIITSMGGDTIAETDKSHSLLIKMVFPTE